MYQINPQTNELIELSEKRFSELGFKEREKTPTSAASPLESKFLSITRDYLPGNKREFQRT